MLILHRQRPAGAARELRQPRGVPRAAAALAAGAYHRPGGLEQVASGAGGAGAPARECPAHDAWLRLLNRPVRSLLRFVVPAALWRQIALTRCPLRIGSGVVKVGVDGLGGTARGVAGDRTGAD
jgi:hypothetical protein